MDMKIRQVPKSLKDDFLLRIYARPFQNYNYYANSIIMDGANYLPIDVYQSLPKKMIYEHEGKICLTAFGLYYVEEYLLENPFKDGEVMFNLGDPSFPIMEILIGASKSFGTVEFEVTPLI